MKFLLFCYSNNVIFLSRLVSVVKLVFSVISGYFEIEFFSGSEPEVLGQRSDSCIRFYTFAGIVEFEKFLVKTDKVATTVLGYGA